MAYIQRSLWEATKKQKNLLEALGGRKQNIAKAGINKIIAEAAAPYAPKRSAKDTMARHYKAQANGILYTDKYAHYQYQGKIMGSNFLKYERVSTPTGTRLVLSSPLEWRSKKGVKKYYTGRPLGIERDCKVLGQIIHIDGYTDKDNSHPQWVWYMWTRDKRAVQVRITNYLKRFYK